MIFSSPSYCTFVPLQWRALWREPPPGRVLCLPCGRKSVAASKTSFCCRLQPRSAVVNQVAEQWSVSMVAQAAGMNSGRYEVVAQGVHLYHGCHACVSPKS